MCDLPDLHFYILALSTFPVYRITTKQPSKRHSYAATWAKYTSGNVVSRMSLRFIKNLVAASAASVTEVPGDSSGESDRDDWAHLDVRVGNMDAVRTALDGIASRSQDDGVRGFGRYASTIRIGRDLWRSPDLPVDVTKTLAERLFDGGAFPPTEKLKHAVNELNKVDETRPSHSQVKQPPTHTYRLRTTVSASKSGDLPSCRRRRMGY